MKIYLVIGSDGEASDFRTWPVAAWTEKEKAEIHARICREKARASNAARVAKWKEAAKMKIKPLGFTWPKPEPFPEDSNPDASISRDTDYSVETVVLNPDLEFPNDRPSNDR